MALKHESPAGQQGQSLHQHKDTQYQAQTQAVFRSFYERPKTMLEVSRETGILRANICRYVSKMRKYDQIAVARYGACPITGFKAGFLTTNPALFPIQSIQQTLFNNDLR